MKAKIGRLEDQPVLVIPIDDVMFVSGRFDTRPRGRVDVAFLLDADGWARIRTDKDLVDQIEGQRQRAHDRIRS